MAELNEIDITYAIDNFSSRVLPNYLIGGVEATDAEVYENGLATGDGSHTSQGTIKLTTTNGLYSIRVVNKSFPVKAILNFETNNGVVNTREGFIAFTGSTITSYTGDGSIAGCVIDYTYTLKKAVDHSRTPIVNGDALGDDEYIDKIKVVITDKKLNKAVGGILVRIFDSEPWLEISETYKLKRNSISKIYGNALDYVSAIDSPTKFVGWDSISNESQIARFTEFGLINLDSSGDWYCELDYSKEALSTFFEGMQLNFKFYFIASDSDGDEITSRVYITLLGRDNDRVIIETFPEDLGAIGASISGEGSLITIDIPKEELNVISVVVRSEVLDDVAPSQLKLEPLFAKFPITPYSLIALGNAYPYGHLMGHDHSPNPPLISAELYLDPKDNIDRVNALKNDPYQVNIPENAMLSVAHRFRINPQNIFLATLDGEVLFDYSEPIMSGPALAVNLVYGQPVVIGEVLSETIALSYNPPNISSYIEIPIVEPIINTSFTPPSLARHVFWVKYNNDLGEVSRETGNDTGDTVCTYTYSLTAYYCCYSLDGVKLYELDEVVIPITKIMRNYSLVDGKVLRGDLHYEPRYAFQQRPLPSYYSSSATRTFTSLVGFSSEPIKKFITVEVWPLYFNDKEYHSAYVSETKDLSPLSPSLYGRSQWEANIPSIGIKDNGLVNIRLFPSAYHRENGIPDVSKQRQGLFSNVVKHNDVNFPTKVSIRVGTCKTLYEWEDANSFNHWYHNSAGQGALGYVSQAFPINLADWEFKTINAISYPSLPLTLSVGHP